MVEIDWSLKLGDFLQIILIAGGGLWFLNSVKSDATNLAKSFKKIEINFSQLETKMEKLTDAIGSIAVTEQKIEGVNRRLDDEKTEGIEFRHWLREEIARLWKVIDHASRETNQQNQAIGELQGRISAIATGGAQHHDRP